MFDAYCVGDWSIPSLVKHGNRMQPKFRFGALLFAHLRRDVFGGSMQPFGRWSRVTHSDLLPFLFVQITISIIINNSVYVYIYTGYVYIYIYMYYVYIYIQINIYIYIYMFLYFSVSDWHWNESCCSRSTSKQLWTIHQTLLDLLSHTFQMNVFTHEDGRCLSLCIWLGARHLLGFNSWTPRQMFETSRGETDYPNGRKQQT